MTAVVSNTITHIQIGRLRSVVNKRASAALSQQDVEDIVQQILLDAHVASLKSGYPLANHAFALAKHTSYFDRRRIAALESARTRRYDEAGEDGSPRFEVSVPDATLERDLRDLIARLDGPLQRVLLLCDEFGVTVEEAARIVAMPRSTVHRRLVEARATIRTAWSQAA